MAENKFKKFLILILVLYTVFAGNHLALFAGTVDVLTAVPILKKSVIKTLTKVQKKVRRAARKKGYVLNTDMVPRHELHITLQFIRDVDEKQVNEYVTCVKSIVSEIEPFDLTQQLNTAHFELLGAEYNWAVLRLLPPKEHTLLTLAEKVRSRFLAKGLKVGPFPDYKAHVSLGQFVKDKKATLPTPDNLGWLPKLRIKLPQNSCTIEDIWFVAKEKSNTSVAVEKLNQLYPLKVQRTEKVYTLSQPYEPQFAL